MADSKMKLGDKVKWTSQANGYTRKKYGEIVGVVPPRDYPLVKVPGSGRGKCATRDHESYVVRANGRLYWPRVRALVGISGVPHV